MKKKILIVIIISMCFVTISLFQEEQKNEVVEADEVLIEEQTKENFKFITSEYDHVDELLKEEFVYETVINYVIQEIPKKNGFYEENGNTYYYLDDILVTGVYKIEEDEYYFDKDGVMQKDAFIDNKYYNLDGKNILGEVLIKNKNLYINENGIVKDNFIDNKYYDINGEYVSGFEIINGNVYYKENNKIVKGIRLINNVRYYFDFETGVLKGKNIQSVIDISTWQGDINFEELKNSNLVDGVIVRLGFGSEKGEDCTLDNKFERNISELKRLNIPYGVYFFGYAQNEYASEVEANFVSNVIKEYDLDLSYPIFYDAELQTFNGVTYTKTMYRKVINKFIDELNNKGFDNVGVYGNLYMLTSGGLSTIRESIPKWVAQYYKECEYDKKYMGWQYTSSGSIPGINGRVDMNIFYD